MYLDLGLYDSFTCTFNQLSAFPVSLNIEDRSITISLTCICYQGKDKCKLAWDLDIGQGAVGILCELFDSEVNVALKTTLA